MYRIYLILTLTISTINWTRRFNARRSEFLKISIRKTSIRGWMELYIHTVSSFQVWFVHEIMNARVSLSVGGTERERGRDREGKKKTGLDVRRFVNIRTTPSYTVCLLDNICFTVPTLFLFPC